MCVRARCTANLTNETDKIGGGARPGSTTVRDRSLASNATTDPVRVIALDLRPHVHDVQAWRGFWRGDEFELVSRGDAPLGNSERSGMEGARFFVSKNEFFSIRR